MKRLDTTEYVALLEAVLADAGTACRTSMARDLETIRSRVEHEGFSFLTITLPAVAKAFEYALETGRIGATSFAGFKSASKASFPAFLQGLSRQVFTLEGDLQDVPNVDAIEAFRQICLVFNKILIECTVSRNKAAEKQFLTTDGEVSGYRVVRRYSQYHQFGVVADYLYGDILSRTSIELRDYGISPRHGPGSTVDRTYGNRKYIDRRWTERLERVMPSSHYKFFNLNELSDNLSDGELNIKLIPRKDEPPVRIVFVPKTMKTPRVIAIEPIWTQEVQQGIARSLVSHIEDSKVVGGHINFANQQINRNLAFESSKTRRNATIDLSEASDRVDPALVARLFNKQPDLRRAVFACRSEKAMLPSGKVISLGKFASQGSALCFPVEAMVFYSIAVSALLKHRGLLLNFRNVRKVAKDVFVYGDDIIIPTQEVSVVIEQLEAAGLKVNRKKSFSSGYFRESCGMDAYMGVNVTPVYMRHPLPTSRHDASAIIGNISTANQFYRKGYWKTCAFLRDRVEKVVGMVPHVPDTSEVSGWHSFRQVSTVQRWNSDLQRGEVRGIKLRTGKVADPLDGYRALHKWELTRKGTLPILGTPEPLEREAFMSHVVRGRTKISFRWASAL